MDHRIAFSIDKSAVRCRRPTFIGNPMGVSIHPNAFVCGKEGGQVRTENAPVQVAVPMCRHSASHPTWGGRSSTRVRVPGRIVRRGPSRFGTLAGATARQAGARKDNAYFTSAPSSPSSVALRRRVAGVSPMSGATRPGECSSSRSRIHSPLSTRVPAHYRLLNVSGSNYSVSVLRCCRRELGASRDTDGIHCP